MAVGSAQAADVFNMGGTRDPATGTWTGLASLETVTVGDAGNTADTRYATPGYGAVAYEYNIGKYEVTAGQYCAFLNSVGGVDTYGLYSTSMWDTGGCKIERYAGSGTSGNPYQYRVAADWANRPVNYVSWGDSVRFANWLTNGQGNGSTETGAYNLNSAMTDAQLMAVVVPSAGLRATWSTGTKPYFLLTSEDEWYKAAYHKGDGVTGNYFDYPTGHDSAPSNDLVAPDPGNNATFLDLDWSFTIGSPYYRTEVGAHGNSRSAYGTFDQGGNVWEWNEAILQVSVSRCSRGGGFYDSSPERYYLHASYRSGDIATGESSVLGFRVVQVPEPATLSLLALGGLAMIRRRRQR
jgi:formylglycine-generating enzyme required for sulfatase activity